MAFKASAASRTERVSGPTWSRLKPSGRTPKRLTRPYVGLSPTVPQNDAGMRIEPPVSLPIAMNTMFVATATPEPPLDPPGLCRGFHGLRTAPHVVQAETQRQDTETADAPIRGLESDGPAKRRGDANRAPGIAAHRHEHDVCRHGDKHRVHGD